MARPCISGSAKTFVVADNDRVADYFSLTVGQVDTLEAPERIRKGMGQYPVPVMILARLAVSQHDRGRGIGSGLLQDAIRRTMLIASIDAQGRIVAQALGRLSALLAPESKMANE